MREMGASDPPPEHHSGALEFCDNGTMLNKLQKGNDDEGIAILKDRISHLPDHILVEILAYLPLKDLVATSVLSRRWRRVFTLVTSLRIDDTPISYCLKRPNKIDSLPNFMTCVDNVLQLCHTNNINVSTYVLHFGIRNRNLFHWCDEGCYPELDPMHLNAWISFPLARGVKVLDIIIHARKPSKIPSALYCCPTLEVLKLDVYNLDLNVSYDEDGFCLPNLKVLHLTLLKHDLKDYSVSNLIESCESLQDLELKAQCWIHINPISSLSLRRLVIEFDGNLSWGSSIPPERTEFVLDVPNLEHLEWVDCTSLAYEFTHMNNLVEAHVDVTDIRLNGSIFGIFSGLSNVQSLYLKPMTTFSMAAIACDTTIKNKLPLFGNLKHLKLGCGADYNNWNYILIELLNCAPLLETLTFTEGIHDEDGELSYGAYDEVLMAECEAWSNTETIPPCLKVNLKRITIYNYLCTQWEMEVVKYFMRSSFVLEELIIICFQGKRPLVTLEAKMLLDNTLKSLNKLFRSGSSRSCCSIIVK